MPNELLIFNPKMTSSAYFWSKILWKKNLILLTLKITVNMHKDGHFWKFVIFSNKICNRIIIHYNTQSCISNCLQQQNSRLVNKMSDKPSYRSSLSRLLTYS